MKRILNKYSELSQFKKNVLSGGIFSGVNVVITLIAYPIYLKYLGIEKYGLWATVSTIIAFSALGQLGIGTAIVKYVSGAYERNDLKEVTEYTTAAFFILAMPSVLIILILFTFKLQIAEFLKIETVVLSDGATLVFSVGILSIFSFFVNTIRGVVAGIGRIDIANYVFLVGRISQLILAVFLLSMGWGVWSLYFGFLWFYIFPLVVWVYILRKFYKVNLVNPYDLNMKKCKELFKFGTTFAGGMIAGMLVTPFNKIIIAKYIGFSEVAYYQIAMQIVLSVRSLFFSALEAILPKVSAIHGLLKNKWEGVLNIHKKGMKFIIFIAIPSLLLLLIFTDPILKTWLGTRFNIQISIAQKILLLGWIANAFTIPDYFLFLGVGKVKYVTAEEWLRAAINIVLIISMLLIGINFSLTKIVIINTVSLIFGACFLKFAYFKFKRRLLEVNREPKNN